MIDEAGNGAKVRPLAPFMVRYLGNDRIVNDT
jgi:hypothetical protein